MFPTRYFPTGHYAPRYFPRGADESVLTPCDVVFDPSDDWDEIGGDDIDVTEAWCMFDGVEVVTYSWRSAAGIQLSSASVRALPRATSGVLKSVGTQYNPDEVTWHIAASSLVSPPARGDRITRTDGSVWVVKTVNKETLGSRYKLFTQRAP